MDDNEAEQANGSRWRGVVVLALIALLVLGGLLVVRQLREAAAVQDCVASGRTNCAPITERRSP